MSMSCTRSVDRGHVVSILHGLIERCREAEMGFRRAADFAVPGPERDSFGRLALSRARFAHELEIEVRLLGGPENAEIAVPSRPFGLFPGLDEALLRAYDEALGRGLSAELSMLLRGHCSAIREALKARRASL